MGKHAKYRIAAQAAAFSDIGPGRPQNQDAVVIGHMIGVGSKSRLDWDGEIAEPMAFAVVDGMGGYAGGADAAALLATSIAADNPYVDGSEADALFSAMSEKVAAAGRSWGTPSMGATFASLSIGDSGCIFLNVGDCRSYKLGGGYLGQMSVDDRVSPESSAISQAIGAGTEVDTHSWRQNLAIGTTRYLLCSDGVWGSISQDELSSFGDPDIEISAAIDTMRDLVYENNASDNCSAVIVEVTVEEAEGEEGETE